MYTMYTYICIHICILYIIRFNLLINIFKIDILSCLIYLVKFFLAALNPEVSLYKVISNYE